MVKIKIKDLPKEIKVSEEEQKAIMGGIDTVPMPESPSSKYYIGTWPTPEKQSRYFSGQRRTARTRLSRKRRYSRRR